GRAYLVAMADDAEEGCVVEIDIAKGQCLGEFHFGLPLSTVGGTRQEGTDLLFFPAETQFVFVLDAAKRMMVGLVGTGHPAGSLRCAPIVAANSLKGPAEYPPHYLILCQADGLDSMRLRPFQLPWPDQWVGKVPRTPDAAQEQQLSGWTWFPPYCDGEKLALATDAGVLRLFGINQLENTDAPLFSLLPQPGGSVPLAGAAPPLGRALVAHGTESDFWVLARGQLQRFRLGLERTTVQPSKGIHVAPLWQQPVVLGSP